MQVRVLFDAGATYSGVVCYDHSHWDYSTRAIKRVDELLRACIRTYMLVITAIAAKHDCARAIKKEDELLQTHKFTHTGIRTCMHAYRHTYMFELASIPTCRCTWVLQQAAQRVVLYIYISSTVLSLYLQYI